MKAVPYRVDFMKALGADCTEEEIISDMQQALTDMTTNLDNITAFYNEVGQESTAKV